MISFVNKETRSGQTRQFEKINLICSGFALLTLTSIAVYMSYPQYWGWFQIIDDHMFISQLKPGSRLTLWQIPHQLAASTELGQFGVSSRYRPTYWISQFLQTVTFKDSSGFRFVTRTIFHFMSSFFILRISKLNIQSLSLNRPSLIVSSNLVSFMIALTSISLVSWTDITTRLGPGEVELVFGICLASYSAFSIIRDRKVKEKSQTRYFIALCIGVIFATGSKENGLIVTLIFIYTLSSSYRRNVFASKLFLGAFTFACLSVAVVATNSLLVLIRGSDVYQSPRSVELIVEALLKNITSKKFIFLSIFVLIMYLLNYRYRSATNNARFTIVLFFYSINLSEFVFYYGSPPAARYLILTQLSELVIFGLTLVATIEFVAKKKFRFIVATIVATMLIYFLWTPLNSATAHNQIANSASELSRQWKAELENLSLLVKSDPVIPIVFHEFKVGDEYERIYSAVQFLRFKGIRNPMFLRVGESRAQSDPLNQVLISQLVAISTTGNLSWEINPLSDLQLYRKFHCVAFKTDLRNPSIPNSFNFAQECLSTFNIES